MKKTFLLFVILFSLTHYARSQDSLALTDTKDLGFLLSERLRLDRNEVAKHDTELFYLIIKMKDSAFAGVDILSKENVGNRKALEAQIPAILKNYKSISTKDKTIIFPLLIINIKRYDPAEYDFVKKLKDHSDEFSIYSSGMIVLLGIGGDKR